MRYGVISFQIVEGGVNSAIFMNYLYESIQIYKQHDQNYMIVPFFDNAGAHLKKEVIFIFFFAISQNILINYVHLSYNNVKLIFR